MFNLGDVVIKEGQGAFKICDLVERVFQDTPTKYFVLFPCFSDSQLKISIPVVQAPNQLRYPISKKEAETILSQIEASSFPWIKDNKERKQLFDDIVLSHDTARVGILYKHLKEHEIELKSIKKSLSITDSTFLHKVKNLFFEELAVSFNESIESLINQFNEKNF